MLCFEPIKAYPRSDRTYALIVAAYTGDEIVDGGIRVILMQIDKDGKFHALHNALNHLIRQEKTILLSCLNWMQWYHLWSTTKNI
jgi:23S rRNA maturation mini-RNase III